MSDQISAYRWVIAWVVLGLLLLAFSKLKVGYTIIYYLAVLTLLILILTQYQAISAALSPFNQAQQGGKNG
jgi:hypothetical protein